MPDQQPDLLLATEPETVILFDGVCNLCNAWVRFVITRDLQARFRFASLGSEAANVALSRAGHVGPLPESLIVIDNQRVHVRSDAALSVLDRLGWPWKLAAAVGRLIPRALRDALYNAVARRRYRWFGKTVACRLPTEQERGRFL